MMRAARFLPFIFAVAFDAHAAPLGATTSVAAPASAVELYTPACTAAPFDAPRFVALLRIELGEIGISDVRPRGTGAITAPLASDLAAAVAVSADGCESATSVTIQVVDRVTSKIVQRTMSIGDVAFDERPRALSIAVAELLQASWAELELGAAPAPGVDVPPEIRASIVQRLAPAPIVQGPATHPSLAPRPAPVTPVRPHALLEAAALVRAFPSRDTALLGGALSLSFPAGRPWALHLGADAGYGDSRVASGAVGITAVGASAGIALIAGDTTSLEIGPRLYVGYVWASGSPSGSNTLGSAFSSAVALALLSTTLRVPSHGFTALLGIDAGAAFAQASFIADYSRVAGIGGVTLAARLGAAFGI
ncbi:MAG TPA: hypothetical protein VH062_36680 [Polyangiaceae bacterium]|jgi:hypothetical protein|nr:hypothetical protein [Polyangiaceae bacterium]